MRHDGVGRFPITIPLFVITILLASIQFSGCLSAFHSTAPVFTGAVPASPTDRPNQHPFQDEMNVPGYLADSFRYHEAGLVNGTCRKTAPHTPAHFWHELLDTSLAQMKWDYISGLCLYSTGPEAHYKRGFLMDILGFNDLAILEYSLAIDIDPDNDRYYNNRGSLYLLGDKPYRAVLDFTMAIEINPNRPEAYYNRGRALERMGKYDEARRDYEKAVDLGICDKLPSLNICR